ncbi:MAG: 1-deoxy-D-xylulose-5-phosphate reductoisomerase [Chloroflexi bacterium]|nr:1-deoxy-D-xylulose-5-phosphate reductoisomerase [Chloroflexota bacterium]
MGGGMKGVAVLGSTGSIGRQTLDVAQSFPGEFRILGLAARSSLRLISEQVRKFRPLLVSCQGSPEEIAGLLELGCRPCSMEEMVCHPSVDLVMMAIVGEAGLMPTLAALQAGKRVALANKEAVVMAGELIATYLQSDNPAILPVDSEPSAIWQCLRGEDREVARLIITASGGPFRQRPLKELAQVTPQEALRHPTWNMGPKITIDSATLMNKAFEVIEAHWLFGVPWDKIEVVVHPQSIIHSMVEFVDGSVKAQMSLPDMRLPIQYALFYPKRMKNGSLPRFDPISSGSLSFESLDPDRYPCFQLALDIAMRGGTWPAALSAADEAAVELFLSKRIGFLEIPLVIQQAIKGHQPVMNPSGSDILNAAAWAREQVNAVVGR